MNDSSNDVPDRLNGWKEIALALGKSVRSAQRWESELGLPVERLTGPDGGQIVQASRRELEAWRRHRVSSGADQPQPEPALPRIDTSETAGVTSAPPSPDEERIAVSPASPVPIVSASPRRSRWWLYAACVAAGGAAGVLLTLGSIRVVGTASRFEIHGTVIQALTEEGYPVWAHHLDAVGTRPVNSSSWGGRVGDLDGDGHLEAAVPISYGPHAGVTTDASDEVRVFTRRGTLRSVVKPDLVVDRQGVRESGPWLFHLSAFSTSGPGRLWTAHGGVTGRPSFVLETGADGTSRVRFLVAGSVWALAHWGSGSTERLVVGGFDGINGKAFVASVRLDGPGSRWPVDAPVPRCDDCGAEAPEAVALLPPGELATAMGRPHPYVFRVRVVRDHVLAETESGVRPAALFRLDRRLTAVQQQWLPRYESMHRSLEAQGVLRHPIEQCPERHALLDVRHWQRHTGWTTHRVAAGTLAGDGRAVAALTEASGLAPVVRALQ